MANTLMRLAFQLTVAIRRQRRGLVLNLTLLNLIINNPRVTHEGKIRCLCTAASPLSCCNVNAAYLSAEVTATEKRHWDW